MVARFFRPILRALWVPVLLAALAALLLREPIVSWLKGEEAYDEAALTEWIQEARVYQTLPELVDDLLKKTSELDRLKNQASDPGKRPSNAQLWTAERQAENARQQIRDHLKSLCDPVTTVYPGRLPLFIVVYKVTVHFDPSLNEKEIVWESGRPRYDSQVRHLNQEKVQVHDKVFVDIDYQMRVYARHQYNERERMNRWRWLSMVGVVFAVVAGLWFYLAYRQKRDRQTRHLRAEQQANQAERLRLEEEVKRQEAEKKQQEAERTALELKSQLFANIGIMAGSYAHNIKNLLVRPNDLLGRCLEQDGLSPQHGHMLREVQQTLGTVTERLQRILQTVRRDPSQSECVALDLNDLVREMHQAWCDVAEDKWKMTIHLELAQPGPLTIAGDPSHLQQALENLLFNARDATFEMRNHLRERARKPTDREATEAAPQRRQALIAAAAWRGDVRLRTRRAGDRAVVEIEDNGIGMTDEVRRRCTETHFSTKRDNALFTGFSAGMGLGLSFVLVILEHHQATLEIASEPLRGARFGVSFPLFAASLQPASS
jgi:signal transduction histidine kinase